MKTRIERLNFEKAVSNFGKENIYLALKTGMLTSRGLCLILNINPASKMYRALLQELNITIPKTNLTHRRMNELFRKNYWEVKELVDILEYRLNYPTVNSNSRYVITFPQHPRASKAQQVKAHIVAWEVQNKQYLPKECGIYFKDGNSFNIIPKNLECKTLSEIKSINATREANVFWKGGHSKYNNYFGGWKRISKNKILKDQTCKICNKKEQLLVHHIIPYSTFDDYTLAHSEENLITVCRHCHGKIHYNKINSWRHIDEIQYEKLLKLLEHLKSQSSDIDLEIIQLIEQQIEQTDNQQPSFLAHGGGEKGSETISKESKAQEGLKKEDSL